MTHKTGFARLLQRFARRDDGSVAIVVALMLPVILGMAALVEASRVYTVKNQLQITADAAAMASVKQVPSGPVTATAKHYAELNMPAAEQYGGTAVLIDSDVETGTWDADRVNPGPFDPAGTPADAVRVTTRAEMPLFFAAAFNSFGFDTPESFRPAAEATALLRPDKCYQNGFVAGGTIAMNSSNTFKSGFCVYGHDGVSMNSSNVYEAGTGVGMSDLAANWTALAEGFHQNEGLEEALFEKDIAAPALGEAGLLIDSLIDGSGPIPDYITQIPPPSATLPDDLVAGTMYIYTGTADITLGNENDIAIISNHSIKIQAGSLLTSVLLASRESVDISSNVEIGNVDFCATGDGASLIISGGAVSDKKDVPVGTESNIKLHGVQVVSDGSVEMNSNLDITGASMQSTGNITFNSRFDVAGCPDETSPNVTGGETLVSQLVD